jgi:hypothetical protein
MAINSLPVLAPGMQRDIKEVMYRTQLEAQLKQEFLENVSSFIHKEKSNKMQQCIKILLFLFYIKLNMFWATHRPSSGA